MGSNYDCNGINAWMLLIITLLFFTLTYLATSDLSTAVRETVKLLRNQMFSNQTRGVMPPMDYANTIEDPVGKPPEYQDS